MVGINLLVFVLAVHSAYCEVATEEVAKNLIEDNIPEEYSTLFSQLPDLNEGEAMMEKRCLKYGTNQSYENAMIAKNEFELCLKDLVDIKKLQKDIERAKPIGELDSVFKEYCGKRDLLRGCIRNLTEGIKSCHSEGERAHFDTLLNVTDSLLNFVCFKEGDRIALFIAEGGPQCLQSKMHQIQECANETISLAQAKIHSLSNDTSDEVTEFILDEEKCQYMNKLHKCIVGKLEECKEPTPANIMGSLFDFVRKSTPCNQYYRATTGASSSLVSTVMSVLVPLLAIRLSQVNVQ